MKKYGWALAVLVTFFALCPLSASAEEAEVIRVGLRFGSTALFSANLENAAAEGYAFGYFADGREFVPLGRTEENRISMTAAGDIYVDGSGAYSASGGGTCLGSWHGETGGFRDFEDALRAAGRYDGGYPAYINGEFVVRIGCFSSRREAEGAGDRAVQSSRDGVIVTVTKSARVLFEFDCGGQALGVLPEEGRDGRATWFKGYKYAGGFEYARTGNALQVVNVLDLEDYVKGVVPYEMNGAWPLAALEAQAVCARTYACRTSKHNALYGFDVCAGADCQVYNGRGSGGAGPSALSDEAVDRTAGEKLYYDGRLVQDAVYHSSNGGATEDAANVWGGEKGYLVGKADPYESRTSIPNYTWSVSYTARELSWILDQKGYGVGTVQNVYVSRYTAMGNVQAVTVEGSGGTRTFTGDSASGIFYSKTYGKSVPSLRYAINGAPPSTGGGGDGIGVNGGGLLASLKGLSVLSGRGILGVLGGNTVSIITPSGVSAVTAGGGSAAPAPVPASSGKSGTFTFSGSGNGHSVGMSQYGAKAMAELGYGYRDILTFYYTDVTIEAR